MKIVEDHGLHKKTVEYDYTPTVEELYLWYSGTHSTLDANNPYARRVTFKTTRYTKQFNRHKRKAGRVAQEEL